MVCKLLKQQPFINNQDLNNIFAQTVQQWLNLNGTSHAINTSVFAVLSAYVCFADHPNWPCLQYLGGAVARYPKPPGTDAPLASILHGSTFSTFVFYLCIRWLILDNLSIPIIYGSVVNSIISHPQNHRVIGFTAYHNILNCIRYPLH